MKIVSVGGGPAGLYFAILMKRADPGHHIEVHERNRLEDTFGFGVVFSDATGSNLETADPETFEAMASHFARWDDIDIHYRGTVVTSTGHAFSGMSRSTLLRVLADRCRDLGVELHFQSEIEDVTSLDADLILAADGFNSAIRQRYAEAFRPTIDFRPNRFVWLGTTRPFPAFTFYFKENAHGLWRVHAYQYEEGHSTFIVETTDAAWKASGLAVEDEDATAAYCEALFAEELDGHPLLRNKSIWRQFPNVWNASWSHENIVLMGDAAHTAHFSVGSGSKLAMEDAIVLAESVQGAADVPQALRDYEAVRRPAVESLQRAAQVSLEWFENTERYLTLEPLQFAFNLLTRSLRVSHENLKVRDPALVARVDRWFADQGGVPAGATPPPLFTPFQLRDLELSNRIVVSPMCQYAAEDGMPDDWHLVHLGSRAIGGAGLVMTEMTDVSADGRISPGCAGLYRPEHVTGWRRIVDFVHRHSGAAIGMQLGHAGRKGSTRAPWDGVDLPLPSGNWPVLAPSAVPWSEGNQVPRAMTRDDMDAVRDDHVRATRWADEAGFDLLEIHMAHGYLLATFISPLTNRRTDAYGGALTDRMRFPLEVFDAVREAWPESKPLSVRVSAVDWAPGGTTPEHAVEVARLFQRHGCDIVDVSAGQTVPEQRPVYGRQFQTPFSDRIRLETGLPTMTVGNISSYEDANGILAAGRADLVVMARAHLWNPYWTRHAAQALDYPFPWPDPYAVLNDYTPRER
jgi:anthraniloyl-CoA monooxygenase